MNQEKPLLFLRYPYRKPTQVDEERILRPAEEALSRNSAKWPRNLGIRLSLIHIYEVMLITTEGIIIRIACADISILGRITSGVKLINLTEGVTVASVCLLYTSYYGQS